MRLPRSRRLRGLALALAVSTTGCIAGYSESRAEADRYRESLRWEDEADLIGPNARPADPGDAAFVGTLVSAVVADEVVRRNPNVRAALERWVAYLERAPQRTSLPNPAFAYRYSSMFRMHVYELMQEVPLPAKLLADGRAALADARAMRAELDEQTNLLRARAEQALANLHLARRSLELVDQNAALVDRFIEIANSRYTAGTATQSDVLRAQDEREGLREERAMFVRDVQVAESMLNVLLDRAPEAPLGPVAIVDGPVALEPLTALYERALQQRPELAAFRARADAQREMLSRAELEWVPDFVVGGGYVRDFGEDEDHVELTAGLSLPVWLGRIRGGVAEAEANVRRADAETHSTRNRVFDEVRQAAARLAAATERSTILREATLPRARQNVEVSQAAYVSGQLDFLALVDAQRMSLMKELELERVRAERTSAQAELRQAVGDSTTEERP